MLSRLLTLAVVGLFGLASTAQAQISPTMRVNWHLTGIAEHQGDWPAAVNAYRSVINEAKFLPLAPREWFIGTAYYGEARCEARLGHPQEAKRLITKAYDHRFWNTKLIEMDSPLVAACTKAYLDSLSTSWLTVANELSKYWKIQEPVIMTPDGMKPDEKLPLVVALHGGNGNYESFAWNWKTISNTERVIVVVPPGVYRESEVTNSWESDIGLISKYLMPKLAKYKLLPGVDSNQIYLTGFSQGAQASIELALRYPHLFKGAIAFSGFTPGGWSDSLLNVALTERTKIYAVAGEWEEPGFYSQLVHAQSVCQQKGIPFARKVVPGMIHEVPLDVNAQFAQAWQWMHSDQSTAESLNGKAR